MMTIYTDVPSTRRQRMHHIMDGHDAPAFSSAKFGPCIDWLFENGHLGCNVKTEENTFHLTFQRLNV